MNLKKVFFNNSFKNTSYILKSDLSNESIIIDVPEDPYPIIDNISDLDIKLILLTHHHLDHAGGIDILRQHTQAPVAIGAEDVGSKPDDRVAHINPDIKMNIRTCERIWKWTWIWIMNMNMNMNIKDDKFVYYSDIECKIAKWLKVATGGSKVL